MQLTNLLAILSLTAVGAVAAPGGRNPPPKPNKPSKPAPPVINNQVNFCSSGSPFCCSPTVDNGAEGDKGTTCKKSTTQCQSISICCNNAQNGQGTATQDCSATSSLKGPVRFE